MKKVLTTLIVALFAISAIASNVIYKVSPYGDDANDGLTWESAFATVQKAVESTNGEDCEIWIAKGTYDFKNSEIYQIVRPKSNTKIYGGFSGTESSISDRNAGTPTTFDAGGTGIFFCFEDIENVLIDGINFQNGHPRYSGNSESLNGGAFWVINSGVKVQNCSFDKNEGRLSVIYNSNGNMYTSSDKMFELVNCTFNKGTCSDIYSDGSTNIDFCTFLNNIQILNTNGISDIRIRNSILASLSSVEQSASVKNCIVYNSNEFRGTNIQDVIEADPLLTYFGYFNSSVKTISVAEGSPAIGRGELDENTTDARGFLRSYPPTIGAFEFDNTFYMSELKTADLETEYLCNSSVKLRLDTTDKKASFSWYKDSQLIANTDKGEYTIPTFNESAEYYVEVTTSTGEIFRSNRITLKLIEPTRYYVSSLGNDENDGTSWQTPFKTFEKAIVSVDANSWNEIWLDMGVQSSSTAITIPNKTLIYGGFKGTENSVEERDLGSYTKILSSTNGIKVLGHALIDGVEISGARNVSALEIISSDSGLNCSVKVFNSRFIDNENVWGGAILINGNVTLVVSKCEFYRNNATTCGGAIASPFDGDNVTISIIDCLFDSNGGTNRSGPPRGGAIFLQTVKSCSIMNSYFRCNKMEQGGAIYDNYSNLHIENCVFNSNIARYGQALYGRGGAILSYYSELNIVNSIFSDNCASGNGGAIWAFSNSTEKDTINISACTFMNNQCEFVGLDNSEKEASQVCIINGNVSAENIIIWSDFDHEKSLLVEGANSHSVVNSIIKGGNTYGESVYGENPNLLPLRKYIKDKLPFMPVCEGSIAIKLGKYSPEAVDIVGKERTKSTIGAVEYDKYIFVDMSENETLSTIDLIVPKILSTYDISKSEITLSKSIGANWEYIDNFLNGFTQIEPYAFYTFTEKNSEGEYKYFYFELTPVPGIIKNPASVKSVTGNETSFCVETNAEEVLYKWEYSEDGVNWIELKETKNSLILNNISDKNNGKYRCSISNKNGEVISEVAELSVYKNMFSLWCANSGVEDGQNTPFATPFNDGISNIEKFAFGLSGNKAASYAENALFKQSYADGKACFQFPISKDAADSVNVKVMTSEDLVNWVEAQSSNIGESGDFNLMQTEQTVPEGGKLFFKLIVEEK